MNRLIVFLVQYQRTEVAARINHEYKIPSKTNRRECHKEDEDCLSTHLLDQSEKNVPYNTQMHQ